MIWRRISGKKVEEQVVSGWAVAFGETSNLESLKVLERRKKTLYLQAMATRAFSIREGCDQ